MIPVCQQDTGETNSHLLNLGGPKYSHKTFLFSTSSIVSFILDKNRKGQVAIDIREPTVY